MGRLFVKLVCLALVPMLLFSACNLPKTDPNPTPENTEEKEMNKDYSILFIGNSYTYYNDMPKAIFEKLTLAAGYTATVTAITKGAWTLEKFADPTDEYGKKVEAALTGGEKYDYVILQEQSLRPAIDPDRFFAAVENLAAHIRATGATPLLYATWGRHSESADLQKHSLTNETMTYRLAASYAAIGERLSIPVMHVGLAFREIYTGESGIDLYNPDLSHPSYAGSYLAAATIYAHIFEEEAPVWDGELAPADAALLRKTAKSHADKAPCIPQAYR